MINVSYKIKNERLKKKMTQENLAEKIFVSRQTISSWENGHSLPSYENFVLLSKIFNMPIDHFYVEHNSEEGVMIPSEIRKQKNESSDLWNVGLLILLIISIFIPYSAPISLCVLFTWKEKITPRFFTIAFSFITSITAIEILVIIFVLTYFFI